MIWDEAFRIEILQRIRQWKSVPRQTGCLWVHAASVGEVQAAKLLVKAWEKEHPDRAIVLSTFTATGFTLAQEELNCPVFRLPLDLPFLIRPLLKRLNPVALVLIEAEFWPNLLRSCLGKHIPVILANGRMSARSFSRHLKLKLWFDWITEPISIFSMRSQVEADRILQLGVDPSRVQVTGNMKFDALGVEAEAPIPKTMQNGEITVVFGSTRPGEERAIANAIAQLSQNPLNYKFIIAPRHVQRCGEVEGILRDFKLSVTRHSELNHSSDGWTAPVLLVDTLGALNHYYRQGHIAFVGGGFDPKYGGHNILEPALLGLPVIYGQYMGNFEEEARLLAESGGGLPIDQPEDVTQVLQNLLSDPDEIQQRGRLAAATVQRERGAVAHNLKLIQSLLIKGTSA